MDMELGRTARRGSAAGMTLVEVMISLAIFLVVMLGILPLFTSSLRSNRSGGESTEVTVHARSGVERHTEYGFNQAPEMMIPAGTTVVTTREYYLAPRWTAYAPPATPPPGANWTRQTDIRQYSIMDLATPLDGATDPINVHLKEIRVATAGTRAMSEALGAPKTLILRSFTAQ
jgi:prepilin-type N-terminal cleavage/methylation domain-containing protein